MHHAQHHLSFEILNNGIISTFHEGVFKVKKQFDCKSHNVFKTLLNTYNKCWNIAIAAAKLLLYRQFILKLSRNNEKLSYNAVSLFNLSWRRSICHILADFCHSRSGNPAVSHVMNQQSTCLRILIVCIVKHAGLDVPWQVMSLHVAFQGGKLVLSETFDAACHDSLVHKQ